MSPITTHVLDTARGRPAAGVPVVLEMIDAYGNWHVIGRGATDADGRQRNLVDGSVTLTVGMYRLLFDTRAYFEAQQVRTFFPNVVVTFEIAEAEAHYHVPLLISPYSYTTYRGS
jgi:5-hydroxyisourate hydrolase